MCRDGRAPGAHGVRPGAACAGTPAFSSRHDRRWWGSQLQLILASSVFSSALHAGARTLQGECSHPRRRVSCKYEQTKMRRGFAATEPSRRCGAGLRGAVGAAPASLVPVRGAAALGHHHVPPPCCPLAAAGRSCCLSPCRQPLMFIACQVSFSR